MLPAGPAKLLSIYLNQGDKWHHQTLYLALMDRAKRAGLAGVTLLHTQGGLGSHGQPHSGMSDYLMVDMPVVVQIVDAAEKLAGFLPAVEEMVPEGLITLSDLEVVRAKQPPLGAHDAPVIQTLLERDIITIAPDTPIQEIAEKFLANDREYVYVTEPEGRLMGIIGKRDLLQQALELHPSVLALLADRIPRIGTGDLHRRLEQAHAFTAEQVMVSPVVSVSPSALLTEALRIMVERGFLEVPVVHEGRLLGVISQRGVLRHQLRTGAP